MAPTKESPSVGSISVSLTRNVDRGSYELIVPGQSYAFGQSPHDKLLCQSTAPFSLGRYEAPLPGGAPHDPCWGSIGPTIGAKEFQ